MKFYRPSLHSGSNRPAGARRALTLVEMMVAMSVFSLVVIGMISAHLFGLRQDGLVNSKLGANDESRRALNRLTGDIRAAKLWRVGTGTETSFSPMTNGTAQQGNALQLSFTTDTNSYVRYFFDANNNQLCRTVSGSSGHTVVARYLTNNMFFRAEDYLGNLKTDLSYKYVVRVFMEFHQFSYPLTRVGPGYLYDRYKMEFKITPHCPDGA